MCGRVSVVALMHAPTPYNQDYIGIVAKKETGRRENEKETYRQTETER